MTLAVGGRAPEAVEGPEDVEGVRDTLRRAQDSGLGVVPVGRGSALGPVPPSRPFVALSLERLAGMNHYDPADLTFTAGAGTGLDRIAADLAPHGQWLPFDPPGVHGRSLGGLVATGARGPLAAAYGAPRDHVLGCTVVTGDGRVLELGGRVMKNVAGFDLLKLVVGSRGALAVITSATVRVFPRPAVDRALVMRAAVAEELVPLARRVATASVAPTAAVLSTDPGGGLRLAVRLHGSHAAVAADQALLLARLGGSAEVAEGEEVAALFTDPPSAPERLLLRATALPWRLGDVLAAVADVLPGAWITADVVTGRVEAAAPGAEVEPGALAGLRDALEAVGGALTLVEAPAALADPVGATRVRPAEAALAGALKERFDPHGTLSPGRFVA